MKATKQIVVLGSSNTDMVVKAARIPVPGETILGGEFMMNPGGKGANQAVAAARLGGDVVFITKTGNDLFGQQSVELYKEEKIDTHYIITDTDNPSGVALITVDNNGENNIVVASGANATLKLDDVRDLDKLLTEGNILLMQLEIPIETVVLASRMAKENNVKFILNPAPAQDIPHDLYENISIIVPNEIEASMLTGVEVKNWETAREAADVLTKRGVETVIITLGSSGALLKTENVFYEIPAQKVKSTDTTAAGDTFCGAICVALSEGKSIKEAVEFANKCAAITVTRMGAQASIPFRKEIEL